MSTNELVPRRPRPDSGENEITQKSPSNATEEEKDKKESTKDDRKNPIERYLDKFNFTKKEHIRWLEEKATFYQVAYSAYSQLNDREFKFCEEMADWLKSAKGQESINEIHQQWARFYSRTKKNNYSVAMPQLIYAHLQVLAKKSNSSMNNVVFNLIEQEHANVRKRPSFEEDVRKRFDDLEKLISSNLQDNNVEISDVHIEEQSEVLPLETRIKLLTKELEEAKNNADLDVSVDVISDLSSNAQSLKSHIEKLAKRGGRK